MLFTKRNKMKADKILNRTEIEQICRMYRNGVNVEAIAFVWGLSPLSLVSQLSMSLPFTHSI